VHNENQDEGDYRLHAEGLHGRHEIYFGHTQPASRVLRDQNLKHKQVKFLLKI
jgi:hypothetical protein